MILINFMILYIEKGISMNFKFFHKTSLTLFTWNFFYYKLNILIEVNGYFFFESCLILHQGSGKSYTCSKWDLNLRLQVLVGVRTTGTYPLAASLVNGTSIIFLYFTFFHNFLWYLLTCFHYVIRFRPFLSTILL